MPAGGCGVTTSPAHGQGDTLIDGLTAALARAGLPAPVGLERLSGGANMESWRFASGETQCVLRRAPSLEMMVGRPMDHAAEAALIRAAHAAGVMAPEVLVELEPGDGIGSGYVMRAIPGSPDPGLFLAEADPKVGIRDIARELVATHRTNPAGLQVPLMDTAEALGELRNRFLSYGGDRPILALALRWLEGNILPPVAPRLVHGDFRLGNLMFEQGQLTGVLDWELAHLGDWHEDLAFGCMTVWRFSRPDRPGYGLTTVDELARAYEEAGGERFDPERFRFWTIYRTFWWALGCLQMGGYWRAGHDRSVERVVVARRTAEQELDLLLLLEDQAPATERERPLPPAAPPEAPGQGEPSGAEILTAVSEWLASDIKPLMSGRGKFDLAVARNALGIVARELEQRPVASDAALAAQLLSGAIDLTTPGQLARLRRMALDKLGADMPKYPALAAARALWEGN
jgi:aminoglycoside phosphotransferase (APT) family kinase protein